jgi:hypothetical protein
MPSFVLSATKLRSFQSIHFLSPSLPSICPHLTPSGPSILQSLPLCAITGLHYACRLFVPLTDLLRCTHDSPASVLSRVQYSTQSNALWAMAALEGSTGRPDGPRPSYLSRKHLPSAGTNSSNYAPKSQANLVLRLDLEVCLLLLSPLAQIKGHDIYNTTAARALSTALGQ